MMWMEISAVALAAAILFGIVFMIAGDLAGAPFVPSDVRFLEKIFRTAKFKPGKEFLDIGSGDGRAVRLAANEYGLKATGIELQPYLVWYSKFRSRSINGNKTEFIRRNFFRGKLPKADYIYFYLFPRTVEKLGEKISAECRPGTVVISRAFEIKNLKRKLTNKIEEGGRRAYFYRI